jgi:hypothetical protein
MTILAPTVVLRNLTLSANGQTPASAFIASVTDPYGLPITQYAFMDNGSDGGYFLLNGAQLKNGLWFYVNSAQLSTLSYIGGLGSETVSIAAYDSLNGVPFYSTATVSIPNYAPPVVSLNAIFLPKGTSTLASSFINQVIDLANLSVSQYAFKDAGGASGYFILNGIQQAPNTWINVSSNNLSQLVYVSGSSTGTDSIQIEVGDPFFSPYFTTTATTTGNLNTNSITPASLAGQLLDAGINNDFAGLISNSSLSFSSVLKILQDVASSIGSLGLSANQLHDLQLLSSDMNISGGVLVSSSLYNLYYKLVNGDAANANWTGGGNTSIALGNLSVGSSANQLNQLINKWFLGGDNPTLSFNSGPGMLPYTSAYKQINTTLFSSAGVPLTSDINQGQIGDCYLMSSLCSIANNDPSLIQSMITSNSNGSYSVRFYLDGMADYVTVNNFFPTFTSTYSGAVAANYSPNIWAAVIEKAFVELNQEPDLLPGHTSGNIYSLIDSSSIGNALTTLTNCGSISFNATSYTLNQWSLVMNVVKTDAISGSVIAFGSYENTYNSKGQDLLVSGHAFSIVGYDSATNDFVVRNPWGTVSGQNWVTQFEVSATDLFNDQAIIYVSTVTNSGATVTLPPNASYLAQANQTITGTTGTNTVICNETSINFAINISGAGASLVDNKGSLGIVNVNNIQRLHFSDTSLALDTGANQAAGEVAQILGAVFGSAAVSNKSYAGIGLSLLDGGMSFENLSALALGVTGASTNKQIVDLLWTNIVGSAPSASQEAPFITMLNQGMSEGALAVLAEQNSLNASNINLVGLSHTGLQYFS